MKRTKTRQPRSLEEMRSIEWGLRMHAGRSRALSALLASALAACSTTPEYQTPTVEMPAAFRHAPAEDGWQLARPAQPGNEAWWAVFEDRRLDTLMAALEAGNQDLRVAEANYRQALAATNSARAGLYPQVSGGAAGSRSRIAGRSTGLADGSGSAGTRSDYLLDLQASWELDLWGRVRASVGVAEASAAASAADLAALRLSLQAQLAQSYFELRVADAQRRVFADTVVSYQRSLKLTRDRLAVGVAARGDVAQAEAQLKNSEAQSIELD
ncbi:MAG TPA: TolC family protein, partial [Burkholderiaceae bacterium]|nr:TolC family protein [Burkholderiaceae bacterium]